MSSGVQYFESRYHPVVQAVRFDGTNRSQIQQWCTANGWQNSVAHQEPAAWEHGAWFVHDEISQLVWWQSDVSFIVDFTPITIEQARQRGGGGTSPGTVPEGKEQP